MINFIVYDDNGTILRTGNCSLAMMYRQIGLLEFITKGIADDEIHYIDMDTHSVVDKHNIEPLLNKTTLIGDGVDSIIIDNLPMPSTVTLDGVQYEVDDGVFEFTVDLPGEYTVHVEALHHLPFDAKVTAV